METKSSKSVRDESRGGRRKAAIAFVGGAGLTLTLAGCANYTGEGNEFVARGIVKETTWQSISADVYAIPAASGEAKSFLGVGDDEEFHDNCDCDDSGFFVERVKIGDLHDQDGNVISPVTLAVGTCVEFRGAIRSDNDGKTDHERPVYEWAQVVPCGM